MGRSVSGGLTGRLPDDTPLGLRTTGTGGHWPGVRPGVPVQVAVAGPSRAVAAWLVGRTAPAAGLQSVAGGELPALAPWP